MCIRNEELWALEKFVFYYIIIASISLIVYTVLCLLATRGELYLTLYTLWCRINIQYQISLRLLLIELLVFSRNKRVFEI